MSRESNRQMVGQRLAGARAQMRMSQAHAAAELKISQRTISDWEHGRSLPSVDMLAEVCALYGVTPNQVVLGVGEFSFSVASATLTVREPEAVYGVGTVRSGLAASPKVVTVTTTGRKKPGLAGPRQERMVAVSLEADKPVGSKIRVLHST